MKQAKNHVVELIRHSVPGVTRVTRFASYLATLSVLAAMPALGQKPEVDVFAGLGTAADHTIGRTLDNVGGGQTGFTSGLTGMFINIGGGVMLTRHFGLGAEYSVRSRDSTYGDLNFRPTMYDFDVIWQPVNSKRFVPEIQLGGGQFDVHFAATEQRCAPTAGCSVITQGAQSSNYTQAHLGAALRLYATPHIFFRPSVSYHFVNDLALFDNKWVGEYTMGIGVSFGHER